MTNATEQFIKEHRFIEDEDQAAVWAFLKQYPLQAQEHLDAGTYSLRDGTQFKLKHTVVMDKRGVAWILPKNKASTGRIGKGGTAGVYLAVNQNGDYCAVKRYGGIPKNLMDTTGALEEEKGYSLISSAYEHPGYFFSASSGDKEKEEEDKCFTPFFFMQLYTKGDLFSYPFESEQEFIGLYTAWFDEIEALQRGELTGGVPCHYIDVKPHNVMPLEGSPYRVHLVDLASITPADTTQWDAPITLTDAQPQEENGADPRIQKARKNKQPERYRTSSTTHSLGYFLIEQGKQCKEKGVLTDEAYENVEVIGLSMQIQEKGDPGLPLEIAKSALQAVLYQENDTLKQALQQHSCIIQDPTLAKDVLSILKEEKKRKLFIHSCNAHSHLFHDHAYPLTEESIRTLVTATKSENPLAHHLFTLEHLPVETAAMLMMIEFFNASPHTSARIFHELCHINHSEQEMLYVVMKALKKEKEFKDFLNQYGITFLRNHLLHRVMFDLLMEGKTSPEDLAKHLLQHKEVIQKQQITREVFLAHTQSSRTKSHADRFDAEHLVPRATAALTEKLRCSEITSPVSDTTHEDTDEHLQHFDHHQPRSLLLQINMFLCLSVLHQMFCAFISLVNQVNPSSSTRQKHHEYHEETPFLSARTSRDFAEDAYAAAHLSAPAA